MRMAMGRGFEAGPGSFRFVVCVYYELSEERYYLRYYMLRSFYVFRSG